MVDEALTDEELVRRFEAQNGLSDEALIAQFEAQNGITPTISAAPEKGILGRAADWVGQQLTGEYGFGVPETDPATGKTSMVGYGREKNAAYYLQNLLEGGGAISGSIGGVVAPGPQGPVLGSAVLGAAGHQLGKEASLRLGLDPSDPGGQGRPFGKVLDEAVNEAGVAVTADALLAGTTKMATPFIRKGGLMAQRSADTIGGVLNRRKNLLGAFTDSPSTLEELEARSKLPFGEQMINVLERNKDDLLKDVPLDVQNMQVASLSSPVSTYKGYAEQAGMARVFPKVLENLESSKNQAGQLIGVFLDQADGAVRGADLGFDDWYKNRVASSLPAESRRALDAVYRSGKIALARAAIPDLAEDYAAMTVRLDSLNQSLAANGKLSPDQHALMQSLIGDMSAVEQLMNEAVLTGPQLKVLKDSFQPLAQFDRTQVSELAEAGKIPLYRDLWARVRGQFSNSIKNSSRPFMLPDGQVVAGQQAADLFEGFNQKYADLSSIEPLVSLRAAQETIGGPTFKTGAFQVQTKADPGVVKELGGKVPIIGPMLFEHARRGDALPLASQPVDRLRYAVGLESYPMLRAAGVTSQGLANQAERALRFSAWLRTASAIATGHSTMYGGPSLLNLAGGVINEALAEENTDLTAAAIGAEASKMFGPQAGIPLSFEVKAALEDRNLSPADKDIMLRQLKMQFPAAFTPNSDGYTSVWKGRFEDPREAAMQVERGMQAESLAVQAGVVEGALRNEFRSLNEGRAIMQSVDVQPTLSTSQMDFDAMDQAFDVTPPPKYSLNGAPPEVALQEE